MTLGDLINQLGIWAVDSVTAVDLIADSTNALCGAILVMRPDHRREENIFRSEPGYGASLDKAYDAANRWLEGSNKVVDSSAEDAVA